MHSLLLAILLAPIARASDMSQPGTGPGRVITTLYSVSGSTFSPVTASSMTMYSYTLPANTLTKAGDSLYITCISSQTGATTNRNNAVYFGGTLLSPTFVSSGSTNWETVSKMFYETSTRLKTFSTRSRSGTLTPEVSTSGDPTVSNLIECVGIGVGTAGDLSGIGFRVEFNPAP